MLKGDRDERHSCYLPDLYWDQYCLNRLGPHTLHKNGSVFLIDVFSGNAALADSVNTCWLSVLLDQFWICESALKTRLRNRKRTGGIEALSSKWYGSGCFGGMHFFNLFLSAGFADVRMVTICEAMRARNYAGFQQQEDIRAS